MCFCLFVCFLRCHIGERSKSLSKYRTEMKRLSWKLLINSPSQHVLMSQKRSPNLNGLVYILFCKVSNLYIKYHMTNSNSMFQWQQIYIGSNEKKETVHCILIVGYCILIVGYGTKDVGGRLVNLWIVKNKYGRICRDSCLSDGTPSLFRRVSYPIL